MMKTCKQREKELDEWFVLAGKAIHQTGWLIMVFVGMLVAVVSITVVSVLGVIDLWRKLTQ